jgi:enoyl-CoA hydratase/carnithine racemase
MPDPMIQTERRGDVLIVTLNRPDRLNAAPPQMFEDLRTALATLDGARAVLIAAAGSARARMSAAGRSGATTPATPPSRR